MRIAVIHNLNPGGALRALVETTRRLSQRHSITIFQPRDSIHKAMLPDDFNLETMEFLSPMGPSPGTPLWQRPYLDMRFHKDLEGMYRAMAQTIHRRGYDVAYVHHCRYTQSPSILRYLKIPTVYFCQDPPRGLYEPLIPRPYLEKAFQSKTRNTIRWVRNLLFRRTDRLNAQSATVLLANSYYSSEVLYRIYGKLPSVVYLGVDGTVFRPLDGTEKAPWVLSVGNLAPTKGHDLAIKSLSLIPPSRRPKLVIVTPLISDQGSPEENYLRQLAASQGVTLDIRYSTRNIELVRLYNEAALTLYTPRLEPFGFVPLESSACGTPVIGVREAGVRETILHQQTGLLVERDPHSMSQAIDGLLQDPDLARRMGQKGTEWVRSQWTWERTCAAVEKAFRKALGLSDTNSQHVVGTAYAATRN
ncbi:MAG: glycosyltransferase family 4 protein [Elusimicrobia bacterium]|nr:glycosyltransferase family 4 protein [Elusimicrobiota bacterium]